MGIFRQAWGRVLSAVGLAGLAASMGFGPMDSVLSELPLSQQLQRIGGSLTPLQVSEILREADNGYMWRLVDLANECRQKDCHLQTVLGTRETSLKGLKWQLVPATHARKKDRKAAAWVEQAIRQSENFPDLVAHLAGGAYHGYAVAETLLALKDGKIVPAKFKTHSARRFIFNQADGQLRQWDATASSTPYPGIDVQEKFPGRFLVYQPRINGDIACREGLARVLVWAALFRNWDMRDWLALGELAWKPWRIGSYESKGDATADARAIDSLRAVLRAMSASGSAVIPKNTEIKVEWPKGNTVGSTHKDLAEFLGAEMSKATLGQTLTTEQGAVGSQSLGNVHDRVRRDILESDATAIAACIMRDLVAPLIRMNFGADVLVPEFEFLTADGVDIKAYSESILNFRKAGLRIRAADVRSTAGLSEPEEGDELLGDEVDIPIDPATGLPAEPANDGQDGEEEPKKEAA